MATLQTPIFNNSLSPGTENLTDLFDSGFGFYLIAPASAVEYQIDIFLQVRVSNTLWRSVRLDPLNVSTTQRITLLPQQIIELGLPMRLAILPSQAFLLEVILLQSDCGLCFLEEKVDEILAAISQAESLDWQSIILDFAIQQLLPQVVASILPGVNNLLVAAITNLLLPAIENLLTPGGGTPALPGGNFIALTGANASNAPQNSNINLTFT